MTKEIQNWMKFEKLEFYNENFENIDLITLNLTENINFNTELIFKNCNIEKFVDNGKVYAKKLTFINCEIGQLWFFSISFSGGFELRNCIIKKQSEFNAIGNNINPNEFIIESCKFNGFVNFFDCYFKGPVSVSNNEFNDGTNIEIYLKRPFGIKDDINFTIGNNTGDLSKLENKSISENK